MITKTTSRVRAILIASSTLPFLIGMLMLFILSKRGKSTQGVLADLLYLEKSTVSRNMRRLFENEYVSKEAFPTIEITDKGLSLLEFLIPHWDNAMAETRSQLGEEGENALDLLLTNLTT